jgi:demethylmenaquinone methyltransferase / 2-methoxy-6-polyprenyl-1,4-benzoquinol methylase
MPPQDNRDVEATTPIPILKQYFNNENDRIEFVSDLFDETAADYNRMERLLGLGSGSWYRRQALLRAGLKTGHKVLDVGTGTGLVAREAIRIVGRADLVTGVDPSPGMLAQTKLPAEACLLQGRAEQLPVADSDYDFVGMGYALQHLSDLGRVFGEFHRVLRPGGSFSVLEITRPRGKLASILLRAYMRGLVPALGDLINRRKKTKTLWQYYWDTIEACVPPERILAQLKSAGFENVQREVVLGLFSEYRGNKPNAS